MRIGRKDNAVGIGQTQQTRHMALGLRDDLTEDQVPFTVGMPVGVGFGIRDAASAQAVARMADAVVIGSRIIEEIEQSPRDEACARVQAFVRSIREAMDTMATETAA